MSSFSSAISSSLRVTEVPLVNVDVLVLPNPPPTSLPASDTSDNWHDRWVLSVVSHKDEWALTEEGALFAYKLKSPPNSDTVKPELQRIYPIYGKFSIVMSQMRRNTIDLSVANTKAVLDQPRSGFRLSITPADGLPKGEEIPTFYATDVQSIGVLVSESKRLREAADVENSEVVNISQSTSHFSWLRPYISKPAYLSLLSSVPADIREVTQPLLQRLGVVSAGQSGNDVADIQLIRDEWIRNNARSLIREGSVKLSVRLGTFNVNGKLPSQDLSSWIQGIDHAKSNSSPQLKKTMSRTIADDTRSISTNSTTTFVSRPVGDGSDPDLFAIGFQEVDLSTEALIYSTGTAREEAWCLAIFAALGERSVHYEKLASKQLVGMLIVILVKKSLKACFSNIQVSSAGSGILGLMGNKGATAVRLTFTPPSNAKDNSKQSEENDTGPLTLTFVNAHLAAFDEMVERRNQEFHDLSRRLTFGRSLDVYETADGDDTLELQHTPSTVSIYETDALFWMVTDSHLNYRVDLPDVEFRNLLADKEWLDRTQVLLRFDQLKNSMRSSSAFHGFVEHRINYLPTYRFNPEFGRDGLGYDQKRRPAWTDRILHMFGPTCNVQQVSYDSYPQITMSDHRPVAANFVINFDLYEKSRYEETVMHLFNEVQDLDGSYERPTTVVDQSFLDFGEIRYDTSSTKEISIENKGKVPCAWRFISPQSGSPIHPDWLIVEPMMGLLLPGDKSAIAVTLQMNKNMAASLNLGPRDMSGTLILHTLRGKDHFIAVSGEYLPTCFGNKLTTLTRLPGPIRSLTSSKALRGENQPLNAPREIMRLVNRLMSSVNLPEDLFLLPPDEKTVAEIRECLDTGEEFPWPPGDTQTEAGVLHAFAQTLVLLLDSLIEPVVPPRIYSQCAQTTSRDEAFELLDALPPAAVNIWITITAFLHFACQSSKISNYAERIAEIFTSVLMRDDPASTALPISPITKRKFFLHFIT